MRGVFLAPKTAMRKIVICLLALVLATPARALNTRDLLSVIAMPLAVAAVSNATGVSQPQLAEAPARPRETRACA